MATKSTVYPYTMVYYLDTTGEDQTWQRFPYTLSLTRTRTGYPNPLWKKQVRSGVQAGTAMSGSYHSLRVVPADAYSVSEHGAARIKPPYGWVTVSKKLYGNVIVPGATLPASFADISEAENQAKSRLYAALRQQRSRMQAGVTAGELPETIRGLRNTASSLARLFGRWHTDSLKRIASHYRRLPPLRVDRRSGLLVRDPAWEKLAKRDPTTWETLERELREGWLNFSLGIRPLVKDVKDLAETVAHWRAETEYQRTRIRGYGEAEKTLAKSVSGGSLHGFTYVSTYSRHEKAQVIYRAALSADYTSATLGSAHRLYQLMGAYDLENWIPTVWNLLPMSFVFDYVSNMASVVNAIFTDTSRVRWIVKTVLRDHVEIVNATVPYKQVLSPDGSGDGKLYPTTWGGTLGGYELTTRTISRSTEASMDLPSLTFNLPTTDGLAYANLLALFVGRTPTSHLNFPHT